MEAHLVHNCTGLKDQIQFNKKNFQYNCQRFLKIERAALAEILTSYLVLSLVDSPLCPAAFLFWVKRHSIGFL